jgi:hypothetical protein
LHAKPQSNLAHGVFQEWYFRKVLYIVSCRMTFLMPPGDIGEQSWNVPKSSKLTII